MTTLNRDPPNSGGYYVELNQCASPCDQQVSSPYCTYQVSAHNKRHAEHKSAFSLFRDPFIKPEQIPSLRKAA